MRERWKTRFTRAVERLGPGVVTGAADDDPSGIATYSQAGAEFGYGLLWTMVLTYPLMSAVQLVSAHIGRVTGCGLAKNLHRVIPRWLVMTLVGILVVANTVNIGADLAAMAAALQLVVGGGQHLFVIGFALLSTALQLFLPYHHYSRVLKWLTLSLFAYVGVLLMVHLDRDAALRGMFVPENYGKDAITTVVAVFGTTISPYLFFWQSSQEAEEIADHPGQHPLKRHPREAEDQYRRMRLDTLLGMAFSNLVALAIMLATAATIHAHGAARIDTAADAAAALRPIAGRYAFGLFALGIIGVGLLAIPVLAGSAAFAVSEARGWKTGLELHPRQAKRFYAIIVVATLAGVVMDWSGLDPIKALFWSAVLNGLAAVPLMAAMMVVVHSRKVMGRFTAVPLLLTLGWAATLVMAAASGFMLLTMVAGG
ncbi:divalent metal cation transporter [Sphingomonas ginkgonis]|uniref:Divalent metal cation transporter n=1 Tax=Sphingomonas ginkgonis TaxID=2315330 RepID=A0A3R9X776_9SPHN|nr:divalent metal cation transporter [Sphingomonas ginkgonis]RST30456.1 divalent metal cation transporter [Sphingomonas ginkgonis]